MFASLMISQALLIDFQCLNRSAINSFSQAPTMELVGEKLAQASAFPWPRTSALLGRAVYFIRPESTVAVETSDRLPKSG
jgi:hypothetical protein